MAATDKEVGDLHRIITVGLTEACTITKDADGKPVIPAPAFFTAAIAFVKNNNITADPTTNKELADLGAALAARKSRRISTADLEAAAEEFGRSQGGFVQ